VAFSQEIESPLPYDSKQVARYLEISKYPQAAQRSTASIQLPLRDDFSQDHFPFNEFGYEVYWRGVQASRKMGFGIDAPTVGMVVFDGLDATGYPYDFSNTSSFGPADTLESVEIDLQDKEGVVLSFFYQPEGLGEFPDLADSLVLEFYYPAQDQWIRQWFALGSTLAAFQQVYIEVTDSGYLVDGFKFRFRNYATLSGSLDHWILDYIFLGDNRSVGEVLIDVGFLNPIGTLLTSGYTSVPWEHYRNNSQVLMLPQLDVFIRNLNNIGAFIENVQYQAFYDSNDLGTFADPAEPSVSASGNLGLTEELNTAPNNFLYPGNVNDTCADFQVNFSFSTSPDQNSDNDLLRFTQRFRDYYAYDDGEAERGYGVTNSPGADVAFRFNTLMTDTIIAMDMFFLPVSVNVDDEVFYLTIWSDGGSGPGEIVYQDDSPRNPIYAPWNGFVRYALQDTLILDPGAHYFGWTQPGTERLNIGNDKNRNNNPTRLFYDTGAGWTQSTTTGTLMMRPVVSSLKPELLTAVEENILDEARIWPVPAQDILHIALNTDEQVQVIILDAAGRLISNSSMIRSSDRSLEGLEAGIYHLILNAREGFSKHLPFVIAR